MISSRSLETACNEKITFLALECGKKPEHSTIAAFVSSIDNEIDELFTKVLLICEEEGLLGGSDFRLDGLRFYSNASKGWSGKFFDLKKKQDALNRKGKEVVKEHRGEDTRSGKKANSARKRREKLIKRMKQKADRIEKFLEENEATIDAGGKEIQSNVTDNESAKTATSHGVQQGYNANTIV